MKLMVISTAPLGKKIWNRPGWYLIKVAEIREACAYAEKLAEQLDKLPGSWLVDTVKA